MPNYDELFNKKDVVERPKIAYNPALEEWRRSLLGGGADLN